MIYDLKRSADLRWFFMGSKSTIEFLLNFKNILGLIDFLDLMNLTWGKLFIKPPNPSNSREGQFSASPGVGSPRYWKEKKRTRSFVSLMKNGLKDRTDKHFSWGPSPNPRDSLVLALACVSEVPATEKRKKDKIICSPDEKWVWKIELISILVGVPHLTPGTV